jgi:mycothiol synthase
VSVLPAGLAATPLSAGDAAEITHVWRTSEEHDDDRAEMTHEDIVAAFKRPSLRLERDTVGVRDDGALVALGVQLRLRSTFVHVLPSHRGRGIGAWLLRWTQDAARAAGHDATGQPLSDGERAARALLEADGYERRWDSWMFEIALDAEPAAPAPPPGYAIRDFEPGRDERAAYDVIERAFSEWPEYEGESFEDWRADCLGRPGFAPDLLALAVRGDEVVGVAALIEDPREGWVSHLAVAREHRGRGLARALLVHAFGVTWRHGRRRCGLGTDSRTGARGLYEHVGMRVRKTYGEYVKQL